MPISTADMEKGISEKDRKYFLISVGPINDRAQPVIDAFWEAIKIFSAVARYARPAHIFLAAAPFEISLPSGKLTFQPNSGVLHVAIENMIFIDVNHMFSHANSIRIACFLEEFVHAHMNVADETLAANIVASIYDKVRFLNGQYHIA
jgi:hypothetical protein